MDSFTTRIAAPASASADPSKRVNYTYGMVLGVDDFVQEQTYHLGHQQWLARDILGYGTVNGLAVSTGKTAQNETEVVVTAGAALSPRGQLIRVAPTQCANISQWLAVDANRKDVRDVVGSPPSGPVSLYVVLCYRACETDRVPIPGEPCRSEENATAASRLKDDFKLALRLTPPSQLEEDAVRDFVMWLEQHIEFTDEPGSFTDLETFRTTLLQAAHPATSPPSSPPDFMHDSPLDVMRVHSTDACEFLREAFRLWVTELRPRWRPVFCSAQGHEEEECLLLAELRAPLTAAGVLDETQPIEIREDRRPFVVHLRMLQEWLLCGEVGRVLLNAGSPPSGPSSPPSLALDDLLDVDAPAPQPNEVLTFNGGAWVSAPAGGASGPAGGDLSGTYPNPRVARLQTRSVSSVAPAAGQALIFDGAQWAPTNLPSGAPGGPPTGPAGGDLTGAYPNPGVARIQARPVSNAAPAAGQVLTWDGAQWAGANLPATPAAIRPGDAAGGDLDGTYPNPGVARLRGRGVSGAAPSSGQVLTWDGSQWAPVNLPPPPTPGPPSGAAGGDLSGTYPNPSVARLQTRPVSNAAPATGQFLGWNGAQWAPANAPANTGGPPTGPAGGDLSGTYPNPIVSRLQTRPVGNNKPDDGDLLTWNEAAGQWLPAPAPTSSQETVNLLPFATVNRGQEGNDYLFWFHLDAPRNAARLVKPDEPKAVLAFSENPLAPDFLEEIKVIAFDDTGQRNVFLLRVEKPIQLARFLFDASAIKVDINGSEMLLREYMQAFRVNFVGFDGDNRVTAFGPFTASPTFR